MRGHGKVYQKKIVDRRRRKITLFLSVCVLIVVLVGGGVSYISQLDSLRITSVKVVGAQQAQVALIENTVLEKIAGNYMNMFARANTFLYPKDEIVQSILGVPFVEDVHVSRDGLQTLIIEIQEHDAVALWCAPQNPSECFKVDETGRVYAAHTDVCGDDTCSQTRPYVSYQSAIDGNQIGGYVIDTDRFKQIHFFVNELITLGVDPVRVIFDREGYMTIALKTGGEIIMHSRDNLTKVLGNLVTFFSDVSVGGTPHVFLEDLEYIKIDSGNKIVYKLKNSTNIAP